MATVDTKEIMERIRTEVNNGKSYKKREVPGLYDQKPLLSATYRQIAHLHLKHGMSCDHYKTSGRHCHVRDLLRYHGRQFLINAYAVILNRSPDSVGLEKWMDQLREDRMTKADILWYMRYSNEGKAVAVRIKGLSRVRFLAALSNLPIFGNFFKVINGVLSLPDALSDIAALTDEHNAFVSRYHVDLQGIQTKLNEVIDQTNRHSDFLNRKSINKNTLDELYASFEDIFRGSRQEIRQRQKNYIPYIDQTRTKIKDFSLLDLGCGRGEWLEILHQRNIPAIGIDKNHLMIKKCKALGMDVIKGDVIEYLRGLPTDSLGAVTAFHLIEHLPFHILMDFIDEVIRVLKKGGVAIFETPNPENLIVGACSFYQDPTHKKPLPPTLMKFLTKERGLIEIEIKYLNPTTEEIRLGADKSELAARFWNYLHGSQDYAIIGYKG